MSRYIDADALLDKLYEADAVTMRGVAMINNEPTVDAVPVEQIESFIDWLERNGYTLLKKAIIKALHDYRADGERRSDGE